MTRGLASRCLRALGGAAPALIAAIWLAPCGSSAQAGTPYTPPGYGTAAPTVVVATPAPAVVTAPVVVAAPAPAVTTTATTTYDRPTQSIRGLWIPGLIGLPISWVVTWATANTSMPASEGNALAYIPLVGPWLVLTDQNAHGNAPLYVAMGIVQDLSALCLVLGLAIRIPAPETRVSLGEGLPALALRATPTATGGALSATIQF